MVNTDSNKAKCAGKNSIAEYLIEQEDFQRLGLSRDLSIASNSSVGANLSPPACAFTSFDDIDILLEFVTKRWSQRWVTTDIHSQAILEKLQKRPFFLLVSVDAPVSLRWQRFVQR